MRMIKDHQGDLWLNKCDLVEWLRVGRNDLEAANEPELAELIETILYGIVKLCRMKNDAKDNPPKPE